MRYSHEVDEFCIQGSASKGCNILKEERFSYVTSFLGAFLL